MKYVTRIHMRYGCESSDNVLEIDMLFIDGAWCAKSIVHDYLVSYPGTIAVGISPYPVLVPAISNNGEKYVKSAPNGWVKDNLLSLPRD